MNNPQFTTKKVAGPGSYPAHSCVAPTAQPQRGFTLIELMVSIGILLVLGTMIIGFLRGALTMSRTGVARGRQYETAQVIIRLAVDDFSQVMPPPPRVDGDTSAMAFLLRQDCWGRQVIGFTRAFGEELRSKGGYDAGRGSPGVGYSKPFTGRNVNDYWVSTGGNCEVVYMLEPYAFGTRLYRAVQSPPGQGGLIDQLEMWLNEHPRSNATDFGPTAWWLDRNFEQRFELVAENVLAFNVECWDEQTTGWEPGPTGPRTSWSISQRLAQGRPPLPYAVRLTIIVGAEDPLRAESPVLGALGPSDSSVNVEDTSNFADAGDAGAYIRVNGELIAYGDKSGGGFGACARGALGTRAQDHPAGSKARGGEAFRRVIQLPASK